jgi:ABC-2 type transport system ATP-binding protein
MEILLEQRKEGKTIMFSTHRMDQVERLCDAICLVNHGRAVLEGNLKQVKSGYGKSSIQIDFEGTLPFLERKDLVQSANNYGNYVELRLQPGIDPQEILKLATQAARINKFELVEPSLEAIFIDTVERPAVANA